MKTRVFILLLSLFSFPAFARQNASEEPGDFPSTFAVIGAGIGSPSSIAIIAGLYSSGWSAKISGAPWGPNWRGIQASITVPFNHQDRFVHGIALVAGSFRLNPVLTDDNGVSRETIRTGRYIGLAYDVLYAGFSVQAGLGTGSGDYKNPQLLLQCGYLITLP